MTSSLPPGQHAIDRFPRFGLTQFAERFPREPHDIDLQLGGDIDECRIGRDDLNQLPRVEQRSDFHCVTTWSKTNVDWGGYRFADFFQRFVVERATNGRDIRFAVFRAQDGYRVGLHLEDLLAADVMLADQLQGQPLPVAHGAPLRLVAPQHYGYKNPKHISRIEFWNSERDYRRAALKFMDHPRARVALEERGRGFPGWFLRRLYRPLIKPTIRKFDAALRRHDAAGGKVDTRP